MEISQLHQCTTKPLKGFNRVFGLNGYQLPADKDSICKYMPLKRLEADVNNSRITFVSPYTWEDSFETRYYKLKGYSSKLGFVEPSVFCMCLTGKHAANEDAFWRRYAPQNDHLVKVYFKIDDLFRILDSFAAKYNAEIYVGEAIYADKEHIEAITPTKNNTFFSSPFEIENYLSLMSLKRGAFRYENEVRIFVVFRAGISDDSIVEYHTSKKTQEKLLFVGYSNRNAANSHSHIGEVRASPYPMIKAQMPKPDKNGVLDRRRKRISKRLLECKVTCSRLFEGCSKCRL